jgi:hypothetical protein
MLKYKVNGNDPHTYNDLKKSIQNAVSSVLPTKLNMFVRCEAGWAVEENNFQYLL